MIPPDDKHPDRPPAEAPKPSPPPEPVAPESIAEPVDPELAEIQGPPAAPANPARKIILITLGLLLLMYVYHVVSDRITPYTSQATVDTLLVQIAPEVTGQVTQVGATDNGRPYKGAAWVKAGNFAARPFRMNSIAIEAMMMPMTRLKTVMAVGLRYLPAFADRRSTI